MVEETPLDGLRVCLRVLQKNGCYEIWQLEYNWVELRIPYIRSQKRPYFPLYWLFNRVVYYNPYIAG